VQKCKNVSLSGYTGEKLKDIGTYFDIGESGVSQAAGVIMLK